MKDSIKLITRPNAKGKPITYIAINGIFLLTLNLITQIKHMQPNDNGVIQDTNEDGLIIGWRKIQRKSLSAICFYVNGEMFMEFFFHDFIDYVQELLDNSFAQTELHALA